MAPDTQILTLISKQDQQDEIQRRLRTQEADKARALLALAMSQKDALFFVKNLITEKVQGAEKPRTK
jgi:hypothetical protein